MKNLMILTAIALVSVNAEARRGQDDGAHHGDMAGCEVKLNGAKVLERDAVVGTPVVADTAQFTLKMNFTNGRLFQATLLDKASGETLGLANDGSGNVMGSLVSDEGSAPVQLVLPNGVREAFGSSASGDSVKLERGVRGALAEAEMALRSNEVPASLVKFECKY
jgi:hypothetical protein